MQSRALEQYNRVLRWHERLDDIHWGRYTPQPESVEPNELLLRATDELYAFFMNCYHLKDWIKHDESVATRTQKAVEGYVTQVDNLRICADICNSLKHLKLSRPRFDKPVSLESTVWESVGAEFRHLYVKPVVYVDRQEVDAFELAAGCIKDWGAFFELHHLNNDNEG